MSQDNSRKRGPAHGGTYEVEGPDAPIYVSYWTARRRALKKAKIDYMEAREHLLKYVMPQQGSSVSSDFGPSDRESSAEDEGACHSEVSEQNSDIHCSSPSLSTCSHDELDSLIESDVEFQNTNDSDDNRVSSDDEELDIVCQQLAEIKSVFAKFHPTRALKDRILAIMKTLSPETQMALPKSSRSLRLPPIQCTVYDVSPGKVVYFGISRVLNYSVLDLFNPHSRIMKLCVNIDGLPLYRNSKNGLWPILGKIEKYPVMILGYYYGMKKPKCSNEFVRPLIKEILHLYKRGINVRGKKYLFRLDKLIMDAPARAYILGGKGHNAKSPCHKCYVRGTLVQRTGLASTSVQRKAKRFARAYLNMNAPKRTMASILAAYSQIPECDTNSCSGGCWDNNDDNLSSDDGNNSFESENDYDQYNFISDDEDEEIAEHDSYDGYIRHQTLFSKVPGLDLVRHTPHDYLHLVCLGVMKRLIEIWMRELMSGDSLNKIDKLIEHVRHYCPSEFQRRPETLQNISHWKGTQYRQFLLYVGAGIMRQFLPNEFLENFFCLVVGIRGLVRAVPNDANRDRLLAFMSKNIDECLRRFLKGAIKLYGPEIMVYNFHGLLHLVEDYALFGSHDDFSGYSYESFNGKLKKFVRGPSNPMKQIVNVYSDWLGLSESDMNTIHTEKWDDTLQFFEEPVLTLPQFSIHNSDVNTQAYERYSRMDLRNFCLRSDNDRDSFCSVSTTDGIRYMKVFEILKNIHTREIYIRGKCFEEVRSLFILPCPSEEIGIAICSKQSSNFLMIPTSALKNKCFAFPLTLDNHHSSSDTEWNVVEYLH